MAGLPTSPATGAPWVRERDHCRRSGGAHHERPGRWRFLTKYHGCQMLVWHECSQAWLSRRLCPAEEQPSASVVPENRDGRPRRPQGAPGPAPSPVLTCLEALQAGSLRPPVGAHISWAVLSLQNSCHTARGHPLTVPCPPTRRPQLLGGPRSRVRSNTSTGLAQSRCQGVN